MKIYLLDDPAKPTVFARFSAIGTWDDDKVCRTCSESSAKLVEPLQIEWNEGTDRIGDFSWGGYICVVLPKVREYIASFSEEVDFGEVSVLDSCQHSKRPRVAFPYVGPELSWLKANARVKLDEAQSGVKVISDCPVCGKRRLTFKREGLVVPRSAWCGEKFFLIEQFGRSRATFITEEALGALSAEGFSNLCPREAGYIVDASR